MTSTERAVRKASRGEYRHCSVARGDYAFCRNSAEFDAALRLECEKAVTSDERWHAREQVSYALACGTVKRADWMAEFIGGAQ